MGYIVAVLLLFATSLLGKLVVSFFKLEKCKHPIVYGLFAYFSGFFLLSGPFTLLHLHWNLYFCLMTVYNGAIVAFLIYSLYRKTLIVHLSVQAVIKYMTDNYLVILLVVFFIMMNFASNNTLAGGATGDDIFYLSWATKNIGNSIYPSGINLVSGEVGSYDLLSTVSFLELFWGYMHVALHIDLVVFVRTSMAIVTYVWFFCTFDEFIFVATKNVDYKRFKYTILVIGLFYYVNGMQSEVTKFMYNPWFGNVFSLLIYLPLLLVFFWHSLTNKKALYLMCTLPFISVGFSPVSILYGGLTMFPFCLLWYKYKTYEISYARKKVYVSLLLSTIFLTVAVSPTLVQVYRFIVNPATREGIEKVSEIWFFQIAFKQRFIFMLPGFVIFCYRLARKDVRRIEKNLVFFTWGALLICFVPYIDRLVFAAFSFPLRRVLDSIMIVLVSYSWAMILLCLQDVTFGSLVRLWVICSFVIYVGPSFYFLQDEFKTQFNINNIFKEKRFDDAVTELETFLFAQSNISQNVCPLGEREVKSSVNSHRIDIGLAVSSVPDTYFNCNLPASPDRALYYVGNDYTELDGRVEREKLRLVKTISTEEFTLAVYEYIM